MTRRISESARLNRLGITRNREESTGRPIRTVDDLRAIEDRPDSNYYLANDIDASETANDPLTIGTNPDTPLIEFTGSFDGRNNTISNITADSIINDDVNIYIGLFAATNGATVKNLTIDGFELADIDESKNYQQIGCITGRALDTNIENCTVKFDKYGLPEGPQKLNIGGIAGRGYGRISECVAEFNQINSDLHTGGIVGSDYVDGNSLEINGCLAKGDIFANNSVGGIVGLTRDESLIESSAHFGKLSPIKETTLNIGGVVGSLLGKVVDCFHVGEVTGTHGIGGIVGNIDDETFPDDTPVESLVADSYSLGDVTGAFDTGGAIGRMDPDVNVKNIFCAGGITKIPESQFDADDVGGLIGRTRSGEGVVKQSYYDEEKSGFPAFGDEGGFSQDVIGLNTEEMTGDAARDNMGLFNYSFIWVAVPNDYPELRELKPREDLNS